MSYNNINFFLFNFDVFRTSLFNIPMNITIPTIRKTTKVGTLKNMLFKKLLEPFMSYNIIYKTTFFNDIDIAINNRVSDVNNKISDYIDTNQIGTVNVLLQMTINNPIYIKYTNSDNNTIYFLMRENDSINDFIKFKSKKGCKDKDIYTEDNTKVKFTDCLKNYKKNNDNCINLHYKKPQPETTVIAQENKLINGSTTMTDCDIYGYIYLIQPREFIKTNEKIYKIGKTSRSIIQRFSEYPKQSSLLYCCPVNCKELNMIETGVIKLFDEKFKKRVDIGSEYYQGELFQMILVINNYLNTHIC